jgi:transposase
MVNNIMGRKTWKISMTAQQRELLEGWIRAKTTPQRVAFRAKICLLAADGMSATDIAHQMSTTRPTILLWRKHFDELGPEGLTKDAPRGPSPRRLNETTRQAIVDATLTSVPTDAAQWTTRTLAKALGVSNATVSRIWKTLKIGPKKKSGKSHKEDRPKQRPAELVGVYLAGPLKVLVVSIQEGVSGPRDVQGPWEVLPRASEFRSGHPQESDCRSYLSESTTSVGDIGRTRLESVLQVLHKTVHTNGAEYHVFIEGEDMETKALENSWRERPAKSYVHVFPCGFWGTRDIAELLAQGIGIRQRNTGYFRNAAFVRKLNEFLQVHNGSLVPFVWTKTTQAENSNSVMCKVILETFQSMVAFVIDRDWSNSENKHGLQEELMSWKQKLESWFAAVAFAEEGEHETALKIAGTTVPESVEVVKIPSFANTFAAAAFAEENCHDYATDIMYGVKRKNSFLSAIGLSNRRVWYGTANLEESFAEAVGLAGVRCRLMTIQL